MYMCKYLRYDTKDHIYKCLYKDEYIKQRNEAEIHGFKPLITVTCPDDIKRDEFGCGICGSSAL